MNPHASKSVSLAALAGTIWRNRDLLVEMTRREVVGRYRGTVIGMAWSLVSPILMLSVYTFVFAVVFKARWGGSGEGGRVQFAIMLFVGMAVHGLFAEVLLRSPGLILANPNYVKKTVFPLEILPLVAVGAALFQTAISFLVLLVAVQIFDGGVPLSAVFLPFVLLPLVLLTLGLAWIFASLGVFLRDVGQTVGFVAMVTLFLSPVFYPMSALPENIRPWLMLNPLTFIIEQARDVLVLGRFPNWLPLGFFSLCALGIAWLGYIWFQKTRSGFADVI